MQSFEVKESDFSVYKKDTPHFTGGGIQRLSLKYVAAHHFL